MGTSPAVDRGRWPLGVKVGIGVVAALLVVIAVLVVRSLATDHSDDPKRIVSDVVDPVAPLALGDGGILFAERTTGKVIRSTRTGELTETVEVADELRTDGQRGVLGLAVRRMGEVTEVFAAWTRASDSRLVVGRLVEGEQMLVWEGPVSSDRSNGGTLEFRGDELLISIGELDDPEAVDDPMTPNGKILALDPAGAPDQTPRVIAGGWHNPFAMAVIGDTIWVVDNSPGEAPERLARVVPGREPELLDLEGIRAPASLGVLLDGDLALCGYATGAVERIPVGDELEPPSEELGPSCSTGVAVLADGSMVTTTDDAVWRDPDPG